MTKNPHAVALGKIKTAKKSEASRKNLGTKGRPKGAKDKAPRKRLTAQEREMIDNVTQQGMEIQKGRAK